MISYILKQTHRVATQPMTTVIVPEASVVPRIGENTLVHDADGRVIWRGVVTQVDHCIFTEGDGASVIVVYAGWTA